MKAPKKIWVWDYATDQMVNENPDSTDVAYIRGDLVDGLVEALEGLLSCPDDPVEIMEKVIAAKKAIAALKAIEEK